MMLRGCLLLLFVSGTLAELNLLRAVAKLTLLPSKTKDFIQTVAEYGYRAEKHEVTTDDGYILTMYRIPPGCNCTKKTPLLLMHGLFISSEIFIDSGRYSPGFVLADECYDVWFGNDRGNFHSRRHVSLDPDHNLTYWKFSVDEMGLYDNPAMVDYVLDATNSKKLVYVGYSQGGGTFFITNSERPEYADKISLYIGLGPSTRQYYCKSKPLRLLAAYAQSLQVPLEAAGVWEVLAPGLPIQEILKALCHKRLLDASVCIMILSALDADHPGAIASETIRRVFEHDPAGTCIHTLAKYGQALKKETFQKFDYGSEENLKLYGVSEAPEFNLRTSTMPAVIFYGLGDYLVGKPDMDWLVSQLPNVQEYVILQDPLWNHFDMVFNQQWKEIIYPIMKTYLNKFDNIDNV